MSWNAAVPAPPGRPRLPFVLLLAGVLLPSAARMQEDTAAAIQAELRGKGHLASLAEAWRDAEPARRIALARAEDDLTGALALMTGPAHAEDRTRLLEALGRNDEALRAIDALLATRTGVETAGRHPRRGEDLRPDGVDGPVRLPWLP